MLFRSLKHLNAFARGVVSLVAALLCLHAEAQTGPANLNVSGGLYLPSGLPVTNGAVNFRLEVLDKNSTCVLYSEQHLGEDLSLSKGQFSLAIGRGTSPNNLLESNAVFSSKIFENTGVIAGGWPGCPAGANLASGEERTVRIYYDLGGGYVAMSPDVPIASSAYALIADTLQGRRPTDFVQMRDDVTFDLNQGNVENVFSSTNYARLQQLLNPSAAIGFGSQRLTNIADPSSAQDATTKIYSDTRLAGQTIDLVDVAAGFGGGKVLTWDQTAAKWVASVPTIAGTAGGDLSGTYPNPVVANLAIGTSKLADNAVTSAKISTTGLAPNQLVITDNVSGATLKYATCANNEILKFVTGTGWQCSTVASLSAVLSVNGKSGVVVLNGADLGLGTASMRDVGVAATNVPELDGAGKLAVGVIPNFAGDISGAYTSAFVAGLQGRAVASTAPNANEVLRWNGTLLRWEPSALVDNVGITSLTGDVSASGTGAVAATITNGVITTPKMFATPGANRLVATDATTGATLVPFVCNLNESLQWTSSGWACANPSTAFLGNNVIVDGGNARGAAISIGTTDNYALNFKTNNTNNMTVLANGNVGIGVTTPTANLEVAGYVQASNSFVVGNSVLEGSGLSFGNTRMITWSNDATWFGTEDLALTRGSAGVLEITNGSGAVRDLNVRALNPLGGNVGIGTTSPNRLLSVNGAINVAPSALPGTPVAGDIAIDSNASNSLKYHNGLNWVSLAVGGTGDFLANGSVAMTGQFRGIAGSASAPGISFAGDIDNGIFAPTADNFAITTSGIEKMRVLANGNVGIGITNPTNKLHVLGGTTIAGSLTLGSDFYMQSNGTAADPALAWNFTTGLFYPAANTLAFSTNDTERMRIDANGSLGIGLTNPARLLDVNGTIRVRPTTLPGTPGAGDLAIDIGAGNSLKYHNGTTWVSLAVGGTGDFRADGSVPMTGQFRSIAGSAFAPGMAFTGDTDNGLFAPASDNVAITTGGNERLRVLANGNVGIGTSAPNRLLQIAGPIRISPAVLPGTPTAGDIAIDASASNTLKFFNGSAWVSTGGGSTAAGNNKEIQFNNSGLMDASSNLTWDSALPELGVIGGQKITQPTGGSLTLWRSDTSVLQNDALGTIKFGSNDGPGGPYEAIRINADQDFATSLIQGTNLTFHTNDVNSSNTFERMRIDMQGNLGIGTAPRQLRRLEVLSYTNEAAAFYGHATQSGNLVISTVTDGTTNTNRRAGIQVYEGQSLTTRDLVLQGIGANVGVGVSAPLRKFHVSGPIRINPAALPGSPTAGDIAIDSAAANSLKYHNGTTWISLAVGGTGDFRADGSVPMTGQFRSILGTQAAPGLSFVGNTNTGIFSPGSDTFAISTGGSEKVRVNSSGNVGIGTTNPIYPLHIANAGPMQTLIESTQGSGGTEFDLSAYGTGNQSMLFLNSARGTKAAPTYLQAGDTVGYLGAAPSQSGSQSARIVFGAEANWAAGLTPGYIVFATTPSGSGVPIERMRIDSTGKVGIGMSATRALSVSGPIGILPAALPTSAMAGDLAFDSAAGNTLKYHNGSAWVTVGAAGGGNFFADGSVPMTGQLRHLAGTASAPGMTFVGDTDNGIFAPVADNFSISTAGVERLRILANGFIGVGTTNPGRALDVNGTVGAGVFRASANGTASSPTFMDPLGTSGLFMPGGSIVGISTAGVERLRVDAAGFVGIGTTNPIQPLNVVSSGFGGPIMISRSNTTTQDAYIAFNPPGGYTPTNARWDIGNEATSSAFRFRVNDGTTTTFPMLITSAGNVGIGVTAPTRLLQVAGAMKLTPTTLPATPTAGDIFVDSTSANALKYHNGTSWVSVGGGGGDFLANGSVPMTGTLFAADGSATQPGIAFVGDTNTGLYSNSADSIGFATNGTLRASITNNGIAGTVTASPYLRLGVGSALSPTYSFVSDTDSGLSRTAADTITLSTAGASALEVGPTGNIAIGTSSATYQLEVLSTVGNAAAITGGAGGAGVREALTLKGINSSGAGTSGLGTALLLEIENSANSLRQGARVGTVWTTATNGSEVSDFFVETRNNGLDSEKLRITGAGNIGIGTTAPTRLLQVAGAMKLTPTTLPATPTAGDIFVDSTSANALKYHNGSAWVSVGAGGSGDFMANGSVPMTGAIRAAAGSVSSPGITFAGDTDTGLYNPFADELAISTGGTRRLSMTATDTFFENTSLYIKHSWNGSYNPDFGGVNYPSIGAVNFQSTATLDNTGMAHIFESKNTATTSQRAYMGTVSTPSGFTPLFVVGQQTGATAYKERLRLDTSGNLGVGVTAPTRILHVAGAMKLNPVSSPGTPTAGDIFIDSAASNALKYHNGSAWVSVGVGGSGDFMANGSVPMTGTLRMNGNWLSNNGTPSGIFIRPDGYVGMGTSNPTQALEVRTVYPNSPSTIVVGNSLGGGSGAGSNIILTTTSAADASIVYGIPGANWYHGANSGVNSGNFMIGYTTGSAGPGAGDHVTLTKTGSLGIGTTTPLSNLHVAGSTPTFRLSDSATPGFSQFTQNGGQFGMTTRAGTGSVLLDFIPDAGDGSSSADIRFFRTTNTTGSKRAQFFRGNNSTALDAQIEVGTAGQTFFAANGGNVGIGTSAPASPLEVRGTLTQTSAGFYYGNVTNIDVAPAGASSANAYGGNFTRLTTSSNNAAGRFLVGSEASVHVNGGTGAVNSVNGSTSTAALYFNRAVTTMVGGSNTVINDTGTVNSAIGMLAKVTKGSGTTTNAYGVYVDAVQGTNAFSVFASDAAAPSYFAGQVGVGTTSPAAKLDVAGEIKFGNSSVACDGTKEGQQRYNSTSKKMEFCNGSLWAEIGGGAVPSGTWCGARNFSADGGPPVASGANVACLGNTIGIPPASGNCPSGYTEQTILGGINTFNGTEYYIRTCIKN